jgi:hypothetical protein
MGHCLNSCGQWKHKEGSPQPPGATKGDQALKDELCFCRHGTSKSGGGTGKQRLGGVTPEGDEQFGEVWLGLRLLSGGEEGPDCCCPSLVLRQLGVEG